MSWHTEQRGSEPAPHPGTYAAFAPFDGVDQNCDGIDGVDADGDGLRQLGFGETESKQALARVRSLRGQPGTLEEVIRLALAELTTGSA